MADQMTPEQLQWVLDHNMQIRAGHRVQISDAVEAWKADKARALAAEAALLRLRQQIEQLPWTKSWDFRDELVKKSEVLACLDTLGASK